MVDEAAEEDEEDEEGVVDAEVVGVAAEAGHGFWVGGGEREGGEVGEFLPWAARGDLGGGA